MQDKIRLLMEREGLTTSRFAELLGVQPSGVSHIVSGRNKPSFELLQRILRRFPRVNPDWLLLDSEHIYRSSYGDNPSGVQSQESTSQPILDLFVDSLVDGVTPHRMEVTTLPPVSAPPTEAATRGSSCGAKVERVLLFYDDGSFVCYDTKR